MATKKLLFPVSNITIIMLYFTCFVNLSYLSSYGNIKYLLVAVLSFMIIPHLKRIFANKACLKTNLLLLCMGFSLVLSSYLSRGASYSSRNYFLSSIVFVAGIFVFFFWMEVFSMQSKLHQVYRVFFILGLVLNIVTDILILFQPELFRIHGNTYFLGTKFSVSYSHIFMIVFYELCLCKTRKKYRLDSGMVILLVISVFIINYVDCMTGFVGFLFMVLFLILLKRNSEIIHSPWTYFSVIAFSTLFVFINSYVLSISAVSKFISTVLNTSETLTGRTKIYGVLIEVLSRRPLMGNGFGSSYDIMMNTIFILRAPNTQNGLCEWILEGGLVTTALFLLLIWSVFRAVNASGNSWQIHFPCAVLYMFAVLSSVEITLNKSYYFCWLALFFVSKLGKSGSQEGDMR